MLYNNKNCISKLRLVLVFRAMTTEVGVNKARIAELPSDVLYIDHLTGECLISQYNIFLKSTVLNYSGDAGAFFNKFFGKFLYLHQKQTGYVFVRGVHIYNSKKAPWVVLTFMTSLAWEKFFFMYREYFQLRSTDFISFIDDIGRLLKLPTASKFTINVNGFMNLKCHVGPGIVKSGAFDILMKLKYFLVLFSVQKGFTVHISDDIQLHETAVSSQSRIVYLCIINSDIFMGKLRCIKPGVISDFVGDGSKLREYNILKRMVTQTKKKEMTIVTSTDIELLNSFLNR